VTVSSASIAEIRQSLGNEEYATRDGSDPTTIGVWTSGGGICGFPEVGKPWGALQVMVTQSRELPRADLRQ
jgi:hypothetical protein